MPGKSQKIPYKNKIHSLEKNLIEQAKKILEVVPSHEDIIKSAIENDELDPRLEKAFEYMETTHLKIIYKVLSQITSKYIVLFPKDENKTIKVLLTVWETFPEEVKYYIISEMEKITLTTRDSKITIADKAIIFSFVSFLRKDEESDRIYKIKGVFKTFLFLEDNFQKYTDVTIGFATETKDYVYTQIDMENYVFTSTDRNFSSVSFSTNTLRESYSIRRYEKGIKEHSIERFGLKNRDVFYSLYELMMEHFSQINIEEILFYYTIENGFKIVYIIDDIFKK
jgi:hypothetical protein